MKIQFRPSEFYQENKRALRISTCPATEDQQKRNSIASLGVPCLLKQWQGFVFRYFVSFIFSSLFYATGPLGPYYDFQFSVSVEFLYRQTSGCLGIFSFCLFFLSQCLRFYSNQANHVISYNTLSYFVWYHVTISQKPALLLMIDRMGVDLDGRERISTRGRGTVINL